MFAAAVIARAAFLVFVAGVETPLTGDAADFHRHAAHLVETGSFLNVYRPPLLSAVLALFYAIVGVDAGLGRWLMVVLSSLTAPAVYLLAREGFRLAPVVALLAGVAWVLYPPSIFYAATLLTETLAALLVTLGLLAYLRAAGEGGWRFAALTGMLWALTSLTRSTFLLLPLAFLAVSLAGRWLPGLSGLSGLWSWRKWLVAFASLATTFVPWASYNYATDGVIRLTEDRFVYGLLVTNGTLTHPVVRAGGYHKNAELLARAKAIEDIAERRRFALQRVWSQAREHAGLIPGILLNRAANFWTWRPDPFDAKWTRNDTIMAVVWVPALVLFVLSLRVVPWRQHWPALLVIAYAFALTLPFWGTPRFRFAVDQLILMQAAAAAAWAWTWLAARRGTRGG